MYDDSHASAWIIDFGKTCTVPDGFSVDHRSEWNQGNHEEGYLTGLDNVIKVKKKEFMMVVDNEIEIELVEGKVVLISFQVYINIKF